MVMSRELVSQQQQMLQPLPLTWEMPGMVSLLLRMICLEIG